MRAAMVAVLMLGLVGCVGVPFTNAGPAGDDAEAAPDVVVGAEHLVAAVGDDAVRDGGMWAPEAAPPDAAPVVAEAAVTPEAASPEAGALCATSCAPAPTPTGTEASRVACAGPCGGNCYGTCGPIPVDGRPCSPGTYGMTNICTGWCDATCFVPAGGAPTACDGTCAP